MVNDPGAAGIVFETAALTHPLDEMATIVCVPTVNPLNTRLD